MTLRPGEVVLIRIDFHQRPGGKVRPAVVLLDTGDEDFYRRAHYLSATNTDFDVAGLARGWSERGFDDPSSQADGVGKR